MAGFGGFSAYQDSNQQAQQMQQAQQHAAQQQAMFQQQQAAQQQAMEQQAATMRQRDAAGNVLGQLTAPPTGQMPAPPQMQAPQPGQASQPAAPPSPKPQGPYTAMPTSPQGPGAPQQGGQIDAPPAAKPDAAPAQDEMPHSSMTMDNAVKLLQGQGLKGADLLAGLETLRPMLDSQAKQQFEAAKQHHAEKISDANQGLQQDRLKEEIEVHKRQANDSTLDRDQRKQASDRSYGLQMQQLEFEKQKHEESIDKTPMSPAALKGLLDRALAGDTTVGKGLSKADQRQLNEALGASHTDAKAFMGARQEASATKKASDAAGTQSGNVAVVSQELSNLLPDVIKYSDAVPRSNFRLLNKPLNEIRTSTNDAATLQLATSMQGAKNLYARLIGGGRTSVNAQQQADHLFDKATSPEGVKSILTVVQQESERMAKAPKEVVSNITGQGKKEAPAGDVHPEDITALLKKYGKK